MDNKTQNTATMRSDLTIEAAAAQALIANYRDVLGDDEEAVVDLVEGETGLLEAISAAVARIAEIDALSAGIKDHIASIQGRKRRLEGQADMLRAAIGSAMAQADLKRAETACGTVSRRATPAKAVVIEEADIPAGFWKSEPKLDKRALLDALKSGDDVPGATLSNGGETISIRGS